MRFSHYCELSGRSCLASPSGTAKDSLCCFADALARPERRPVFCEDPSISDSRTQWQGRSIELMHHFSICESHVRYLCNTCSHHVMHILNRLVPWSAEHVMHMLAPCSAARFCGLA